jgi:hypothetical protein
MSWNETKKVYKYRGSLCARIHREAVVTPRCCDHRTKSVCEGHMLLPQDKVEYHTHRRIDKIAYAWCKYSRNQRLQHQQEQSAVNGKQLGRFAYSVRSQFIKTPQIAC